MNKVIIMGRLTKDCELRTTNTGKDVANFTVAVDRRAKKGEDKQADFIDCVAWGQSAVFVNQYFHKGDGIALEGRLECRKWQDKDGNNRYSWEVITEQIYFPVSSGRRSEQAETAESTFTELPEGADGELPF